MCVSETWSTEVSLRIVTPFPTDMTISPAIKTCKFGRAKGGLLLFFYKLIYTVSVLDITPLHIFVKDNSRFDCLILGVIEEFSPITPSSLGLTAEKLDLENLNLVQIRIFTCR